MKIREIFLNKIVIPLGDYFNKSNFGDSLNYWKRFDTYSEEDLIKHQNIKLNKLLEYTIQNVPFYKNIDKVTLNEFPVMTKELWRNSFQDLISDLVDSQDLISYKSSGSSGIQSEILMSKFEQGRIRALQVHWWKWTGFNIGMSHLQTGITFPRPIFKKCKDFLFGTFYVSAFSLSNKDIHGIVKKIKRRGIKTIVGYPSSINVIAEHILEHNILIKLDRFISLGDKLFDNYKVNIKNAFHCKIYDTYGANEGLLIACQKDLEYKYIMTPHVYLEILDDKNRPVADGEMGNVVVTRLDGYSMPLIRYKLGDLAIKLPRSEYPEKRELNYPLLKKIVGRETDIVKLPDGKILIVHSFTGIFEYIEEIQQFMIIQKELNGIEVHYIPRKSFTPSVLTNLDTQLHNIINCEGFCINYLKVKEIEPSPSGKPQIIKSLL